MDDTDIAWTLGRNGGRFVHEKPDPGLSVLPMFIGLCYPRRRRICIDWPFQSLTYHLFPAAAP